MVERQEPIAVGRVDDGRQVGVLRDLVLEAALHPQRVQQVVDLAVGESEHGGFLATVERVLEVVGKRAFGPGDATGRLLGAGVVVLRVGGARCVAAFHELSGNGRTDGRSLDARRCNERRGRIIGGERLVDGRLPEVRRLDRHVRDAGAGAPGREAWLRVEGHAHGDVIDRLDGGDGPVVRRVVDVIEPSALERGVNDRVPGEGEVLGGQRLAVRPEESLTECDLTDPRVAFLDGRLEVAVGEIRHELDARVGDRVRTRGGRRQEVLVPDRAFCHFVERPLVVGGHVLEDAQGVGPKLTAATTGRRCCRAARVRRFGIGLGGRLAGARGERDRQHGEERHQTHLRRRPTHR